MPTHKCPFTDCDFETDDVSDQLAATLLSIHASGDHAPGSASASTSSKVKVEAVRRPTISSAGSSEEWSYFLTRWTDYTSATKVAGTDRIIQLLECCNDELRKDLTRTEGGSLSNKPEADVLAAIKKLAVREENTMVARVTLHEMKQDRDEPIRAFGARIQGQANVCKYLLDCSSCGNEVNYKDQILRDVLTRGISDPDIQLDLLSSKNQEMTLEEVFRFVEAKEAGKRSASRILASQEANSASSQYRRNKQQNKTETCSYCGKTGHGRNAQSHIRKQSCPAYNQTCRYCSRSHHIESTCRSKARGDKPPAISSNTSESAIFTDSVSDSETTLDGSICTISTCTDQSGNRAISLDHHLYNHLNNRWVRRSSKPQPFITVSASVQSHDYHALGFALTSKPKPTVVHAMADTGCQSCLASMTVIQRLGIHKKDLIPVTMRMHAANNNGIQILGAAIVRFSGKAACGDSFETRQIVYVTKDSDKLFLSREACMSLGIISENFPTIGEVSNISIDPNEEVLSNINLATLNP